MRSGLARRSPFRQPLDGLRERLAIAEQRHDVLEDHAGFGKSGTSRIFASRSIATPSSLPAAILPGPRHMGKLRQLLRRLAEQAQVLEPLLVPLGVA